MEVNLEMIGFIPRRGTVIDDDCLVAGVEVIKQVGCVRGS